MMPPAWRWPRRVGATYRLDGTKSFVLDGHTAEPDRRFWRGGRLGGARRGCPSSPSTARQQAWSRRRLKTMDETRKLARLDSSRSREALARREGALLSPRPCRVLICLANEMVGGGRPAAARTHWLT